MKGKIVLVQFPFDDLSDFKVRPAHCLTDAIGDYNPHSALQLLRQILVTKTRQFDDTTDRNSLIAVTQN